MLQRAIDDNGPLSNELHPSSDKVDDVEENVDDAVPFHQLEVHHEEDAVMEKEMVHQDDHFLEDEPVGDEPLVICPPMESEFKGLTYLHSLQRSRCDPLEPRNSPHQEGRIRSSRLDEQSNRQ